MITFYDALSLNDYLQRHNKPQVLVIESGDAQGDTFHLAYSNSGAATILHNAMSASWRRARDSRDLLDRTFVVTHRTGYEYARISRFDGKIEYDPNANPSAAYFVNALQSIKADLCMASGEPR